MSSENENICDLCKLCGNPLYHGPIFECNCIRNAEYTIKKAIIFDTDAKFCFGKALKQYINAIDYFVKSLRYIKDPLIKQNIRQKVDTYVSRADQIQKILDPNPKENDEKKENDETKYKICKTCGSSWNSCPEDYDDEIEKRLIRLATEDCLGCTLNRNIRK